MSLLRELLILFLVAVGVAVVCYRLRIPALVGFLIAGVIAGPHGFGWISEIHVVEVLAEIGVALLLFVIGIEFSLERLYQIRWTMVLGGGVQLLLTASAAAVITAWVFSIEFRQAIFLGMLLSVSSTAIVLKLISERTEADTPYGRTTFGILLFQDLCVLPMMILTPVLAGEGGGGDYLVVLLTMGRVIVFLCVAILCGRLLFPWVLEQVAHTRSRELFLLVIVVLCLGTAWLSYSVGFSLAMGAFVAGLIVSQSDYSHQAMGEIIPFRDIFSCIFLMSIGMLLDPFGVGNPLLLLAGVAGIILLKTTVASFATLLLGYPFQVALLVGFSLAQVGEFSFVLADTEAGSSLLSQGLYQFFLGSAVVTMILSPFLKKSAPWVADRLERTLPRSLVKSQETVTAPTEGPSDHVIVLGYGPIGRLLAKALREISRSYVIVEMNPRTVREEKSKGEPIVFGDASRPDILEHARIHTARVVVVVISDLQSARRATVTAKRLNPRVHTVVRVRFIEEVQEFLELGADEVVADEFETSHEVSLRALKALGVSNQQVAKLIS